MTSLLNRELREEDAEQVAALFVDAFGGARKLDAHEVASWLRDPDLRHENLRVLEEDGRIVGYCDIAPRGDALFIDLAAPGRWEELLDWAEGQVDQPRPEDREPVRPARARARAHRRSPRLREAPRVADDGDRVRRAATRRRLRRARAAHVPRRRSRRRDRCAQRCVLRGPVLPGGDARAIRQPVPRQTRLRSGAVVPRLGRRRARRASRSTIRSSGPRSASGTSTGSASASRGAGVVSPKRCSASRSASCTRAASTGRRSASTRRTSPARCACTSASACTRRIRFGTWQKDL